MRVTEANLKTIKQNSHYAVFRGNSLIDVVMRSNDSIYDLNVDRYTLEEYAKEATNTNIYPFNLIKPPKELKR